MNKALMEENRINSLTTDLFALLTTDLMASPVGAPQPVTTCRGNTMAKK